MALNFPGPYQLRFFYTTTVSSVVLEHTQALNINLSPAPSPGDAFDTIQPVFPISPTATDLADLVDQYVTDWKAAYSSGGSTMVRCELWEYEPSSFDASFVSAYTINVAGTSGSGTQSASQSIVTMRTNQGGIFKFVLMESVIVPGVTDPGTISNAALEAIIAKIESGEYPFIGRDGGWPFARIQHYPGQSEKIFKLRNRP